jgi:hypothetical protein
MKRLRRRRSEQRIMLEVQHRARIGLGESTRSQKIYTRSFVAEEKLMKSIACKLASIATAVVLLTALAGCSGQPLTTREKGTGIGAVAGAATGAIIGAAVGAPGAGAAIGGALGAGGGFLIGNALQNQEVQNQQTQSQINSQQREIENQRREIEQLKQQQEVE